MRITTRASFCHYSVQTEVHRIVQIFPRVSFDPLSIISAMIDITRFLVVIFLKSQDRRRVINTLNFFF